MLGLGHPLKHGWAMSTGFYDPMAGGGDLLSLILVEEHEPIDKALRRFKKECQKTGILAELRKREYYEKPSVKRRRKMEAARRKQRRRMIKLQRKLDRY